jgi:carbohydrate kinase (thermoresistant glucokinase family)
MKLVVMGVCGCGKSSVGARLAQELGLGFADADDLHPVSNRQKMSSGQPLQDEDRWPWLEAVGQSLAEGGLVMACSALKRTYRDRLRQHAGADLRFVHLTAPEAVFAARLQARKDHFMPPALLTSQLAILEPLSAEEGFAIDVSDDLETVVAKGLARLRQNLA